MPHSRLSAEITIGYRRESLEEVWNGWVGNQTPAEFLSYGHPGQSIRDQVADYVASFDYAGAFAALDDAATPGESDEPDETITRETVRQQVAAALIAYLEILKEDGMD